MTHKSTSTSDKVTDTVTAAFRAAENGDLTAISAMVESGMDVDVSSSCICNCVEYYHCCLCCVVVLNLMEVFAECPISAVTGLKIATHFHV